MYRVVYVSSATRPMTSGELTDVAHRWQASNKAAGITGVCLYIGGNFMQAFEGDDSQARSLFTRILADPRHRHIITILSQEDQPERLFGDWSLDFRESTDLPSDQLASFMSFIDRALVAPKGGDAPLAISLLTAFVRTMHK